MKAQIANLLIFGLISVFLNRIYGFDLFTVNGGLFLLLMGAFYYSSIYEYKSSSKRNRYFLVSYKINLKNGTEGWGSVNIESTKGFPSQDAFKEHIEEYATEEYSEVEGIIIAHIFEFNKKSDYDQFSNKS